MALTVANNIKFEVSGDPFFTPALEGECRPLREYHNLKSEESGLRLSWPRAGDIKRARVGNIPSRREGTQDSHVDHSHIVQVSQSDIEMHYHFSSSGAPGTRPVVEVPLPWNPTSLEVSHQELFRYFRHTASKALVTFGHDPTELGSILARIALSSKTVLSTAVLQALLAFSSLHRHGVHPQAVELKIAAIKTLSSASVSHMNATEATQHVAAGMLLSSFEILQATCTSGEWTWYLRGVKDVIHAAGLDKLRQDSDLAVILDWVYYHDVLARFSLRHWHRKVQAAPWSSDLSSSSNLSLMPASLRAEPSKTGLPALALIELLSEVCDAVSKQTQTPVTDTDDHTNFLKILDWRIRTTTVLPTSGDSPDTPLILELYQLAMLVYINRANPKLNPASKTQKQIERGFEIFAQLRSCDRQFPIFILGCEARSDEQRAVVLDLISRTEKGVSSRSFNYGRVLVQSVWAQDDLASGEIDYLDKLSYVISCCKIVPTFA
ncbi:hypothetical protein CONLIGDRAFT_620932 [Coniochaeta ligniaria NRRL 30616]|uniref:Transcription factor domain-containing protein n=1 Tax=Coniochaeta ligniaria NRRL 30616 TaxID=1408157 RepID=A0A1J7IHX5_9PEZI|nr:hypothetical protein CONLIGDRAFT_620932 [Coniochaeta ligniaria NRRL 30616]